MINIDQLIGRVWELEGKYADLQQRYQLLIHQYEELKKEHEASSGHRNQPEAQQDMVSSN